MATQYMTGNIDEPDLYHHNNNEEGEPEPLYSKPKKQGSKKKKHNKKAPRPDETEEEAEARRQRRREKRLIKEAAKLELLDNNSQIQGEHDVRDLAYVEDSFDQPPPPNAELLGSIDDRDEINYDNEQPRSSRKKKKKSKKHKEPVEGGEIQQGVGDWEEMDFNEQQGNNDIDTPMSPNESFHSTHYENYNIVGGDEGQEEDPYVNQEILQQEEEGPTQHNFNETAPNKPASKSRFGRWFSNWRHRKAPKNQQQPPASSSGDDHWTSNPELFNPALSNTSEQGKITGKPVRAIGTRQAKVILLDCGEVWINLDRKANGQALINLICSELQMEEKEYFGVTWVSKKFKTWFWLDLEKKISDQLKDGEEWLFNFQVKFYPPEPSQLQQEITRYQLCLQVRQDVYTGKLPCSWVTLALLGSYQAQSEIGPYADHQQHNDGEGEGAEDDVSYLKELEFYHTITPELLAKICEFHKKLGTMAPEQADIKYLETAKRLEYYGLDLHPAKDSDDIDIFLGISFYGVFVYRDRVRLSRFAWPKVLRIAYRKAYFYLRIRSDWDNNTEGVIGFRLMNYKMAKRLWKNAIEHHTFFRIKDSAAVVPPKAASNLFGSLTLGSKFRYVGRTFAQQRQEGVRQQYNEFDRTLSKRHTMSVLGGLQRAGLQYSSMHSLHRPHPRDMAIGKVRSVEYLGLKPGTGQPHSMGGGAAPSASGRSEQINSNSYQEPSEADNRSITSSMAGNRYQTAAANQRHSLDSPTGAGPVKSKIYTRNYQESITSSIVNKRGAVRGDDEAGPSTVLYTNPLASPPPPMDHHLGGGRRNSGQKVASLQQYDDEEEPSFASSSVLAPLPPPPPLPKIAPKPHTSKKKHHGKSRRHAEEQEEEEDEML